MHGSRGAGGDDEAEQRERAVARAVEEPLPDAAAHSALGRRLLEPLRQPAVGRQQLGEPRPDQAACLGRRRGRGDDLADLGNEARHERRVHKELVLHAFSRHDMRAGGLRARRGAG